MTCERCKKSIFNATVRYMYLTYHSECLQVCQECFDIISSTYFTMEPQISYGVPSHIPISQRKRYLLNKNYDV